MRTSAEEQNIEEKPLKIVIIGDGGVGKSAMLYSYIEKVFVEEYIPTVVDVYRVKMSLPSGRTIRTEVYDTAGQEDYKEIRKANLQGADLVIICYSCEFLTSLENIEHTWVPEVKSLQQEPDYILVGTKKDLYDPAIPACVTYKDGLRMAKDVAAKEVIECSAKIYGQSSQSKGNIDKVFKAAVKHGLVFKKLIGSTRKIKWCRLL